MQTVICILFRTHQISHFSHRSSSITQTFAFLALLSCYSSLRILYHSAIESANRDHRTISPISFHRGEFYLTAVVSVFVFHFLCAQSFSLCIAHCANHSVRSRKSTKIKIFLWIFFRQILCTVNSNELNNLKQNNATVDS